MQKGAEQTDRQHQSQTDVDEALKQQFNLNKYTPTAVDLSMFAFECSMSITPPLICARAGS